MTVETVVVNTFSLGEFKEDNDRPSRTLRVIFETFRRRIFVNRISTVKRFSIGRVCHTKSSSINRQIV